MDSIWLCSFLLTVITGPVLPFPGDSLALVPVTEESYTQAIIPHILDGLNSLNSVANILPTNTNLLQDIPNNVRQLLESSFKSLSEAEQTSQTQERAVSTNVIKCVNMIKKLEDEQKILKDQQQMLSGQLSGLQVEESHTKDQQRAALEAVNIANIALNKAYQVKRAAEENAKKAIGLFVPFAGPVLGGLPISAANKAIEAAEKEVNNAKQTFAKLMDVANKDESKIQSLMNDIRSIEQTIAAKSTEIQANQQDLSREKSQAKNLQDLLIPLRKCTTLLGSVESTNVMGLIGKLVGLPPALNDIIVALLPLIAGSSTYQLQISSTILNTIAKLGEASLRLK